ncbi:MAG: SurA N-terminal domain-containing protein [Verrucomicrobiota bacterium]
MLAALRRQQKWILIVVAAIIIVAFAWFYNKVDTNQPPGATTGSETAFNVYGQNYTVRNAQRLARSYGILRQLGMEQFAESLRGQRADGDLTDFAINMTVLRREAEKLAVIPSREEIQRRIRELPPFSPQGAYDARAYQLFVERLLTPNGFTQIDFEQLIGDALTYEKLQELFSANIEASPEEVEQIFKQSYTQYKVARVDLPESLVEDKIEITDEEIQKFYDENKQAFLSDPKRRIAYVHFPRPVFEEEEVEETEETDANADENETDEGASETAKSDDSEKPETTNPVDPEERLKQENEMRQQVHEFVTLLAEGASFTDAAKKQGLEIHRPDAFSLSEFPEDLKDAYALQGEIVKASLAKPISKPVPTSKGYYVFELLEVIEGQPLELKDAREDIVNVLTEQKTREALSKEADVVLNQIEMALKSGKKIVPAARQAKAEVEEIPPFSLAKDRPGDFALVTEATKLKPGEIAKVDPPNANPFLVYVESTTLPDDEETQEGKQQLTQYLAAADGAALFQGWFQQKIQDANPGKSVTFSAGQTTGG